MSVTQNAKLSERVAILATAKAATSTAGGTITSQYVNIAGTTGSGQIFGRLLVLANAVNVGTNVVTVNVNKASNSAGTGASSLISQTAVGVTLYSTELDVNSFTQALNDTLNTYLAVSIVSTTGTLTGGGYLLGGDGRYDPASYWNETNSLLSTNLVI